MYIWEILHCGKPKPILTISVLNSFLCWVIPEFVHSLDIRIQVSKGHQTHIANAKFFHAKEIEIYYSAFERRGLRAKYCNFISDTDIFPESQMSERVINSDWLLKRQL